MVSSNDWSSSNDLWSSSLNDIWLFGWDRSSSLVIFGSSNGTGALRLKRLQYWGTSLSFLVWQIIPCLLLLLLLLWRSEHNCLGPLSLPCSCGNWNDIDKTSCCLLLQVSSFAWFLRELKMESPSALFVRELTSCLSAMRLFLSWESASCSSWSENSCYDKIKLIAGSMKL